MKNLSLIVLFLASAAFANDPNKILTDVQTSVHHKQGTREIDGYTFERIDRDSLFESIGVQTKDILKSVDGESINNFQKVLKMAQTLQQQGHHEVLVERDGKFETLPLDIK